MEFPKIITINLQKLINEKFSAKYGKSAIQCSYPDNINIIIQKIVMIFSLVCTATNINTPHSMPYKNSSANPYENFILDIDINIC